MKGELTKMFDSLNGVMLPSADKCHGVWKENME